MKPSRNLSKCTLVISILLGVCSVFVSALPQWVWNPQAETGPKNSIGSGDRLIFGGQIASEGNDKKDVKLKIEDVQGRLFLPGLLNTITGGGRPGNRPVTSRPSSSSSSGGGDSSSAFPPPTTDNGGGGSSNSGGSGGGSSSGQGEGGDSGGSGGTCNTGACIGGSIASQAIDQGINAGTSIAENNKYDPIRQTSNFRAPVGGISGIFSNIISSLFGGNSASTLPAGIGGIGGIGSGSGGSSGGGGGGSCTCEEVNRGCFLPARETGTCDGNRIRCCTSTRGTRTFFPDENGAYSSTNSVKSVSRSQIRRALLKNIVRGSGSIIDDTLDLLLHPFLTREDQLKVATRVILDD